MSNQKTIIAILCIVIAILIVCVAMLSIPMLKEESRLLIPDDTIDVGDSLVVVLTDKEAIGLSNATINVKLTDEDGVTIDEDITTDSKGKAKLKVEEAGKYSVECTFNGEGKYSACSLSDSIEVEKATTELVSEEQTSTTTHSSKYAPNGGIYPEYGPEVDHYGKTREFAIANDWHYIPLIIDGEDVGGYTAIDPNTGTYHR
ncbi:MAG: hypothetical protein IJH65_13765 [Methanobrevibacter sp.]|nr:hypothetical protein [Methanobrevibacter sp.]